MEWSRLRNLRRLSDSVPSRGLLYKFDGARWVVGVLGDDGGNADSCWVIGGKIRGGGGAAVGGNRKTEF